MTTMCDAPPHAPSGYRALALAIGNAAALYFLYTLAILALNHFPPSLPPLLWVAVTCLSTVGYILIILHAVRLLSRVRMSARLEGLLLGVALGLFLLLNPLVWQAVALLRKGMGFWELFAALTGSEVETLPAMIAPFFLILIGAFFGRLVARLINETALLVPVSLGAALIDFWGVYWGFVNRMSESAPLAVSGLGSAPTAIANVPPAVAEGATGALAVLVHLTPPENIGIGDFVFLTLLLTCAFRLGFSAGRAMWGIFTGLLLASLIMALDGVTLFGHEVNISYLPGLVFICGGFLLFNLSLWKLSRREWLMTGAIVVLLCGAISYSVISRKLAEPAEDPGVSYTAVPVTGDPAKETIQGELQRISRDHPGLQVLPQVVDILYARASGSADARQWRLLVLARSTPASIRGSYACAARGQQLPDRKTWQIERVSITPPQRVLPPAARAESDDLTRVRQAAGLPTAAWTALDRTRDYARITGGKPYYLLRLSPAGGVVLDGNGKMVKRLKY